MTSTAKANAIANAIAQDLKLRTSLTVTQSFNTDGLPLITVGTGSIGAPGALIRVSPQDWSLAKDILGLTANIYSPTVVEVAFEANPTAGAGAEVNTLAHITPILGVAVMSGARVMVYNSANGDSPDENDMIAGNLKSTWDASAVHGIIANQ